MFYVYLIKSLKYPDQTYIGYTLDIAQRLETHNSGCSVHTEKYRPWHLVMHLAFHDKFKALEFEKYLKTQSGRAFALKRFW